ncbi:hypothetical protein B5P22_31080 [Pseudomonas tolaasii]|nr:hypothetical protein B5P22_31080 [Pseudomonas tolaasii]
MAGSKPIEPGCLVLILSSRQPDSPNVGKMGTVSHRVYPGDVLNNIKVTGDKDVVVWAVEGPGLKCFVKNSINGNRWDPDDMCLCRTPQLLRIDPQEEPLEFSHGRS